MIGPNELVTKLLDGKTISEIFAGGEEYDLGADLEEIDEAHALYRFDNDQLSKVVIALAHLNLEWGHHFYRALQSSHLNLYFAVPFAQCAKCPYGYGLPCENKHRYEGTYCWGSVGRKDLGSCPGMVCVDCTVRCVRCEARLCPNCVLRPNYPRCEDCYSGGSMYTTVSTGTCDMCRGEAELYQRPKSPLTHTSNHSLEWVDDDAARLTKVYQVLPGCNIPLNGRDEAKFLALLSADFQKLLPQELWRTIFVYQL